MLSSQFVFADQLTFKKACFTVRSVFSLKFFRTNKGRRQIFTSRGLLVTSQPACVQLSALCYFRLSVKYYHQENGSNYHRTSSDGHQRAFDVPTLVSVQLTAPIPSKQRFKKNILQKKIGRTKQETLMINNLFFIFMY